MAEENLNADDGSTDDSADYQPPAIEEVLNRAELEREVAYAGTIGNSGVN